MSAYIQRPWLQSIQNMMVRAQRGQGTDKDYAISQFHKLIRNFAVSIDVGGPSVHHVPYTDNSESIKTLNGKERYLLWVKRWKVIYRELSDFIRYCKTQVKLKLMLPYEVERLKESAQVMLNARHLGKLASWAIVQRNLRLNTK